jgi:hypothetical protein
MALSSHSLLWRIKRTHAGVSRCGCNACLHKPAIRCFQRRRSCATEHLHVIITSPFHSRDICWSFRIYRRSHTRLYRICLFPQHSASIMYFLCPMFGELPTHLQLGPSCRRLMQSEGSTSVCSQRYLIRYVCIPRQITATSMPSANRILTTGLPGHLPLRQSLLTH